MLVALAAFSILPALHFIRSSLTSVAGSRSKVSGLSQTRLQRWRSNTMLATQVSLSLLLATMAGCFAATLAHWESIDVGMDREHVLSVYLDMGRTGYASHQTDLPALYRRIKERLESEPGVRTAAVEMCPLLGCGWNTALYVFGRSGLSNAQLHGQEDHVGPGFFTAMGIPLLRGRDFSQSDGDATQQVAILSHSYARQLFGDETPIGHWVGYEPAPNDHKFLVVGEVADARIDGARSEPPPVAYMSINQKPYPAHTIQVRAVGNPNHLSGRIREVLRQIDSELPVTEIISLNDGLNDGLGTEKLLTRLAAIYAGSYPAARGHWLLWSAVVSDRAPQKRIWNQAGTRSDKRAYPDVGCRTNRSNIGGGNWPRLVAVGPDHSSGTACFIRFNSRKFICRPDRHNRPGDCRIRRGVYSGTTSRACRSVGDTATGVILPQSPAATFQAIDDGNRKIRPCGSRGKEGKRTDPAGGQGPGSGGLDRGAGIGAKARIRRRVCRWLSKIACSSRQRGQPPLMAPIPSSSGSNIGWRGALAMPFHFFNFNISWQS